MKRILAFLLLLAMILPLTSCASDVLKTKEDTQTEEPAHTTEPTEETREETKPAYTVKEPLTWAKINAIPVATEGMTSDQLRQICVDYFRLQASFAWTPNRAFEYEITSSGSMRSFRVGKSYGGIPYFTSTKGGGNLYLWMEYYDEETGILNVGKMQGQDLMGILGNQCAHGAFWGWSRVINSAEIRGTKTYTQKNGCLNVGPYTYDPELEEFSTSDPEKGTDKVCQTNGEQVMYQSYAALLPGDGINATHTGNWHVRMISSAATVVKKADGTIDGEKSYVLCIEQAASVHNFTAESGETLSQMSKVDQKYTFAQLYKGSYIPFTFAEFLGTDPVEKAEVRLNLTGDTVTAAELKAATVTSNYTISNLTVQVVDASGEVQYRYLGKFKPSDTGGNAILCTELSMDSFVYPASLNYFANKEGLTLQVLCRVGTGENLVAFEGKLVK